MGIGTTKMSMPIRVNYLGASTDNRGGVCRSGTQTGSDDAVQFLQNSLKKSAESSLFADPSTSTHGRHCKLNFSSNFDIITMVPALFFVEIAAVRSTAIC